MDQYLLPGYYKLISASITQYGSRVATDISGIIHRISIEESIEKDSMRGSLSVIDAVGLLEKLPLRGEERLTIEVEDILKQKKIYDLFIYKVDNVSAKNTNDALSYDMHFVSYMRWNAGRHRIIAPFSRSIRETVEEIFKRYYSPFTKKLITDSTDGNFECIIPNYTPIQAMSFLASRAYNSISPSCSFRFFENSEAFYFVPDEYLIADAIVNDNIKEFTFLPAIEKTGNELEAQLRNLIELKNTDRINTVSDLYSGAYKSNPIVIDFVNKTVTDNRYSYLEKRSDFVKYNVKSKVIEDLHSDGFINYTFTDENERRFIVYKDYQSLGDLPSSIKSEQFLPDLISRRLTYRYMLYRNTVYAKSYGRLDLKAGDIIKLVVPEFSSSNDNVVMESQLSGNYILHDCTHVFDKETYETSMMLTKFDWSKNE
jgi:hypothetical protein